MTCLSDSLLAQTIEDHIAWMAAWTRIALLETADHSLHIESLPSPESFVAWRREATTTLQEQPALERLAAIFDQLHRLARLTILKAPEGSTISAGDYEAVSIKYLELVNGLRRMERALSTAASGLDTLTGLRSRAGMRDDLAREISRFHRTGKPFCLALMDLDTFKRINDTYGHENGDKVLTAAANHVSRSLRAFDDAWRWGGEEFLLCLKEAELSTGLLALERVRASLEKSTIKLTDDTSINISASFGVTVSLKGDSIDDMLAKIDKALYRAKAAGRNRIETAA